MAKAEGKITAQRLKMLLRNCIGFEGDSLSQNRKDANDYYFQRPRNDEVAGRSQIVTGDVSSMVDSNLGQMIRPLLDKRLAEFCAYGPNDVEQSQTESDCVHYMLFQRQNGFIELVTAVKNALMFRNAVVKVWVETLTHKSTVNRENVDPLVVTDVLDKIGNTKVHSYDPETRKLNATVEKTTRKFRCVAMAPENFLVPSDWDRQDLDGIPYCAERHVDQRSKLIELGFPKDKVDRIKRFTVRRTDSDSRLPKSVSPNNMPVDKAGELVEWYEMYIRLDDGSGASELHKISFSDKDILDDDADVPVICFATGVILINPHSFIGISLYDKLKSTQDSSTALTRALMDNLSTTSRNRTAHMDGVVDADDLSDGRTNGSIRVRPGTVPDVRMAITAFQVPDTSGNILGCLQHMKGVRSEMGGAALELATGNMQLNDRLGSQGLDRAYSVMEQNAEFMMTVCANTLIRNMYLVAHEVLRTDWQEEISFERGKSWVTAMPSKWQMRESISVNVGKSPNERARQGVMLEKIMAKQESLASAGMENILVDSQGYYNALVDWGRINDLENPERYWVDPRSPNAVKAFQQKQVTSAAQAKDQRAMMMQAVGLEQLRVSLQKYIADGRLQYDYYNTVLNAQVEEAKITASAVIDWFKTKATAVGAFIKGGKADGNEIPAEPGATDDSSKEPASESDTGGAAGGD